MEAVLHRFLISSFPGLRLGEKPFYTSAEFLEQCAAHLDPERQCDLERSSLLPRAEASSLTERKWQEFEVYLRNRVAQARAARLGVTADAWLRHEEDVFPALQREIDEALGAPDPLSRERALDALRWRRLEDLVVGHEADFDALVNYRLRLLLAEKWAALDAARGSQQLHERVAAACAQAEAVRSVRG